MTRTPQASLAGCGAAGPALLRTAELQAMTYDGNEASVLLIFDFLCSRRLID